VSEAELSTTVESHYPQNLMCLLSFWESMSGSRTRARITFDTAAATSQSDGGSDSSKTRSDAEEALDLNTFRNDCLKLQKHANKQKDELGDREHTLMISIGDRLAAAFRNDDNYEKVHAVLIEVFGNDKPWSSGSVGNFFVGCLGDNAECSPECAGNVPLPKGPGGRLPFCDSHVAYYKNGELDRKYAPHKKSTVILIHVEAEKCVLSRDEVASLKAEGITSAVISVKKGVHWKVVTELIPVEQLLPAKKVTPLQAKAAKAAKGVQHRKPDHKKRTESEDDGCSWGIWIIVIFFFIIVIVVVIGYCCFRGGDDGTTTESTHHKHSTKTKHSSTSAY
jgi:hypothetical protein